MHSASFSEHPDRYRVKPEPRKPLELVLRRLPGVGIWMTADGPTKDMPDFLAVREIIE